MAYRKKSESEVENTVEETKVKTEKTSTVDKEKEELKTQLEELKAQMALMAQMMGNKPTQTTKSNREITFVSMVPGTLVLKGTTIWKIEGQFNSRSIMESEAEAILSNMNNAIRNGIVYIADAQFVKEHNLEAVYAHLITDTQLKELLSMNAKHVVDVYKNANDTQKQVIIDMVSEKKLNGQEIDANILIELGKLCRKDLISIEPIEEEG